MISKPHSKPSASARSRLGIIVVAIALAGCGRPPPQQQGPPGDFVVPAVIAKVQHEELREDIRLVGSFRAIDTVEVASETEGRLTQIVVDEGTSVQQGALLLRLDPEMPAARLQETEAGHRLAQSEFQRGRDLVESQTISQQEFDRLDANFRQTEARLVAAKRSLADTAIHAPFDGVVGERYVSPGAIVTRGMSLMRLVRLDPLEAEFHVSERYFSKLSLGQEVSIVTVAHPGQSFLGTVTFIAPSLDLATRTVLVKATVPNAEGLLRPGMFGQAQLTIVRKENAILLPEAALVSSVGRTTVAMLDLDDRVAFREVKTGTRVPGRVEIVEGLQPGDRVIVEGHQKVGPGSKVSIAPDSIKFGLEVVPPDKGPAVPTEAASAS